MKLDEFVTKYINKGVDWDKKFGFQCVDVFRQYCYDVWEIPHTGGVDGAKDLWLNYDKLPLEKKYLDKFTISRATPGDVIIWNSSPTNKYGHVAILLGITDKQVLVFEQDGFKQDGAKIKLRSRENVLGVLRKK
ncbi:MAG: CHAP domain-containing protein [Bacilli bacterium]|nr:CHAP domain-containing protein [Bacilli bacterium]